MPGLHRNLQFGPDQATVSTTVLGGQLVMPDPANAGLVKPATQGATTVLGVAMSDANPANTNPTSPLNTAWANPEVSVQYGPADVDLTFASNVAYGQLVIAAAAGQVAAGVGENSTSLAAAASAAATTISTVASIPSGSVVTIDPGATGAETRTTTAVSGSGPYTVTVPALTNAHASGVTVEYPTATGSTTFDQVVGRCTAPLGVTSGSVGRVRLFG